MLQQAGYWAYVDSFFAIALIAVVCGLGVLFLKRIKSAGPVAVH